MISWFKSKRSNELQNIMPKEGDIVRIKSGGGPIMVVGCRLGDANWCSWWNEELRIFSSSLLYLSQLEAVDIEY